MAGPQPNFTNSFKSAILPKNFQVSQSLCTKASTFQYFKLG